MTNWTDLPLADTSDMIGLHSVFRLAIDFAPKFVGETSIGDTDRVELVGSYYANVLELLHSHHQGEDELLSPRLLERAPEQAVTIERISQQHQAVLHAVDHAENAIATWRFDPSVARRDQAITAVVTLGDGLTPHLDEEEGEILPLAAQCINVAEWGQLPEHGMRSFRGDKMWLIIGLIQEQMTPTQRSAMEAHMPPPFLEFWSGPGRPLFESYIADLRT
jgi:hypothetical protein